MWRSEENLKELVTSSFYHGRLRYKTWVHRLGSKHHYPTILFNSLFLIRNQKEMKNVFSGNHLGVRNRLVVWMLIKYCVWSGGERILHSFFLQEIHSELLEIVCVKRIWLQGFSAIMIMLLLTYLKHGLFTCDSFKYLITNVLFRLQETSNRWPHL